MRWRDIRRKRLQHAALTAPPIGCLGGEFRNLTVWPLNARPLVEGVADDHQLAGTARLDVVDGVGLKRQRRLPAWRVVKAALSRSVKWFSFRLFLLFDVLLDDRQGSAAARDNAIGPGPEHRLAVDAPEAFGKFLAQQARCCGFGWPPPTGGQGADNVFLSAVWRGVRPLGLTVDPVGNRSGPQGQKLPPEPLRLGWSRSWKIGTQLGSGHRVGGRPGECSTIKFPP